MIGLPEICFASKVRNHCWIEVRRTTSEAGPEIVKEHRSTKAMELGPQRRRKDECDEFSHLRIGLEVPSEWLGDCDTDDSEACQANCLQLT